MLINPSLHNFLENVIFDFQITIDTIHPVQISSRSDNCMHHYWPNVKIAKNAEKITKSQK